MSARIRLKADAATLPRPPMHGASLSLGGSTHNKKLMIETFLNKHFDADLEANFPSPNSTSAPQGAEGDRLAAMQVDPPAAGPAGALPLARVAPIPPTPVIQQDNSSGAGAGAGANGDNDSQGGAMQLVAPPYPIMPLPESGAVGLQATGPASMFYNEPIDVQLAIIHVFFVKFATLEDVRDILETDLTQATLDAYKTSMSDTKTYRLTWTDNGALILLDANQFFSTLPIWRLVPTETDFGNDNFVTPTSVTHDNVVRRDDMALIFFNAMRNFRQSNPGAQSMGADDERSMFFINPRGWMESQQGPGRVELYRYLPSWGLICAQLGELRDVDEGSVLSQFNFPSALFNNSVLKLTTNKTIQIDVGDLVQKAYQVLENVDNIGSYTNERVRNWMTLIVEYAKSGEVPYDLYTTLAQTSMTLGHYESSRGIMPFWTVFDAVKTLRNANCLATQLRFAHQIFEAASRITCKAFLKNAFYPQQLTIQNGYVKLNRFQLEKLQRSLIDAAVTHMVLRQEIFWLWQRKIGQWIVYWKLFDAKANGNRVAEDEFNRLSPNDNPPDWFKEVYRKLANDLNKSPNIPLRYQEGRFGVPELIYFWRLDFNFSPDLYKEESIPTQLEWSNRDDKFIDVPIATVDDLIENYRNVYRDRYEGGVLQLVPPYLQGESDFPLGRAIDYRVDAYSYYTRLVNSDSSNMDCTLNEFGVFECQQDIDDLDENVVQYLIPTLTNGKHRNAIGKCTHSSFDSVFGYRNITTRGHVIKKLKELKMVQEKYGKNSNGERVDAKEFMMKKLKSFEEMPVEHPSISIPKDVAAFRMQFEAVQKNDTEFKILSGLSDADSLDGILVMMINECENQCCYIALKMHEERCNSLKEQDTNYKRIREKWNVLCTMSDIKLTVPTLKGEVDTLNALQNQLANKRIQTLIFGDDDVFFETKNYNVYSDFRLKTAFDDARRTYEKAPNQMNASVVLKQARYICAAFDRALQGIDAEKRSVGIGPSSNSTNALKELESLQKQARVPQHDVYHCYMSSNKASNPYTSNPILELTDEVSVTKPRIELEEAENHHAAYDIKKNSRKCNLAIQSYLNGKQKEIKKWENERQVQRQVDFFNRWDKILFAKKSKLLESRDPEEDPLPAQLWGTERPPTTKDGLLALAEYLVAAKAGVSNLAEQNAIQEESDAFFARGYISRRSSADQASFYPPHEDLMQRQWRMSYVDDGPVKVVARPLQFIVSDVQDRVHALRGVANQARAIDLQTALDLVQAVENGIEALFLASERLFSFSRESNQIVRSFQLWNHRQPPHSEPYPDAKTYLKTRSLGRENDVDALKLSTTGLFRVTDPFSEKSSDYEFKGSSRDSKFANLLGGDHAKMIALLERYLLFAMQQLGQVVRFGGYRLSARGKREAEDRGRFIDWRFPQSNQVLEEDDGFPYNGYDGPTEEMRFYGGILHDRRPDKRSWSDRMHGDTLVPPNWQVKTFNGCKIISNESYDTDNLFDYMFRDPDSVLNQLCDVADKYLQLFSNGTEEEEEEEEEDESSIQDLNDAMQINSETYGLKWLPNDGITTIKNLLTRWDELDGFHSVLFKICKFSEQKVNLRSEKVDILENEAQFRGDPYPIQLIETDSVDSENLFKVPLVIGMTDEDKAQVYKQVAEKWRDRILNNSVLLRWPYNDEGSTDGQDNMRWGGDMNPDLDSALFELNSATLIEDDAPTKGAQLLIRLTELGERHAETEIQLKLRPPGTDVAALETQKRANLNSLKDKNSLYRIVEHAIQLCELDKKIFVQDFEQGPFKQRATLETFADMVFENIKAALKDADPSKYTEAIFKGQQKGIAETFKKFGERATKIGEARAKYHYIKGKIVAAVKKFQTIQKEMNRELKVKESKFVFQNHLLNLLALKIKTGQGTNPNNPDDYFGREGVEAMFKQLVLDGIKEKSNTAVKPDDPRIAKWKASIKQWYQLHELTGFSPNVFTRSNRMQEMEHAFREMNNDNAWYQAKMLAFNAFDAREKTSVSRSAADTLKIQRGKSGIRLREEDFLDRTNKRPYPQDRVQAFKELARDIRQLVMGWEEPFFPDPDVRQAFIDKVGQQNWDEFVTDSKEKYPGIGKDATFAALQTYGIWFAKFLSKVLEEYNGGSSPIITNILADSRNIYYEKNDKGQGAPIIPNAKIAYNPNDISIKGRVALSIPKLKRGYILLDLYSMYDNDRSRPLFNELRRVTLDAKTQLDVEYKTLRRFNTVSGGAQPVFDEFRSLVQELNSQRVKFTTRACDFMMEIILRVNLQFASPRILIRQVQEFCDTNPVLTYDFDENEPRTHFRKIFEELVQDLEQVEKWEARWDAALPHLEVLRREDLYKRLKTKHYDTSGFTLMDANNSNVPHVIEYRYELGSATLGDIPVTLDGYMVKGFDLRFATSDDRFGELYKKYVKYQTDDEDLRMRENDSMKAVSYVAPTETQTIVERPVLIPTAAEVCNAMNALRQFGVRDPEQERLRPIVRLVDAIDRFKYAYFRDVLCLHFQKDEPPSDYPKEMVVQACKNRFQPNGQSDFDNELRRIYNPNRVPENRRENRKDDLKTLWSNTRFLKSTNKSTQDSVYVVDEVIRSYSLLRQTNLLPSDQATKDSVRDMRSNLGTVVTPSMDFLGGKATELSMINQVQRLPVNATELGTYLDAFKKQLDLEWPPGIVRDNLPQDVKNAIQVFNTTDDSARKFDRALFLQTQLGIPMYQRPYPKGSTTSVVQEPSYAEFREAGRQVWLETMLDTLDNTNPKNMYDQDFVRRMSLFQPGEEDDGQNNPDAMQVDRTEKQAALMRELMEEQKKETRFLNYIPSQFEIDRKYMAPYFPGRSKREREANANSSYDERNNRQRQAEYQQNAQENRERSEAHYNRWLGMAKQRNSSGWVGAPSFTEAEDPGSDDSALISLFHQTNATGSCFFHSVLINIAMFYKNVDQDNLHQTYIDDNRFIYKLREDLIAFYYQTINDLEALNNPNAAGNMIPGELNMSNQAYEANTPSQPNFHRWQAVAYLNNILERFDYYYMTPDQTYYRAYQNYEYNRQTRPDWPQLNSNSTSMECLKAYVKNLSLSSTYAELIDMYMMAHMLKACIFQYSTEDEGERRGWKEMNPLVIGDTRYLTELDRPPILIHHRGVHFMAITFKHVERSADEVAEYESENRNVPIPAAQLQQMDVVDDDGVFDIIDVLAPRNGQARRDAGFQP